MTNYFAIYSIGLQVRQENPINDWHQFTLHGKKKDTLFNMPKTTYQITILLFF